ncbi:MAG: SGNH/GDSL hydrolase family protein [Ruminococcaceae bacterium]|nr:SGNH/GDSL hydrolase family protein [Oscillospiraceae bacterium]
MKGKRVNFLGDSITAGTGTSCYEKIYHQVMKREYGLAEARVHGVSGSRFARQSVITDAPRDRDFCLRATEMEKDADVIVVFGGTNDFGHGDAPIGSFADREPCSFYGACHTLFRYLVETYPDAVIAVCTPLHRVNEDNPKGDGNKAYHYGELKEYVAVIREVAQYYSLPVIDLFAYSGLQPKVDVIRERYVPDGLHPNDAGHERIARVIGNFLLSY